MQRFFLEKLTIVLKIKVKCLNWKTVKGQIKTYNFKRQKLLGLKSSTNANDIGKITKFNEKK